MLDLARLRIFHRNVYPGHHERFDTGPFHAAQTTRSFALYPTCATKEGTVMSFNQYILYCRYSKPLVGALTVAVVLELLD